MRGHSRSRRLANPRPTRPKILFIRGNIAKNSSQRPSRSSFVVLVSAHHTSGYVLPIPPLSRKHVTSLSVPEGVYPDRKQKRPASSSIHNHNHMWVSRCRRRLAVWAVSPRLRAPRLALRVRDRGSNARSRKETSRECRVTCGGFLS